MNERIVEMVVGVAFLYTGYLEFSSGGLSYMFMKPIVGVHVLCFFAIGALMLLSRPHIAVVGLGLLAIGISVYDTGFFNSYSFSYLFSRFRSQPFMFLKDFLLPVAAIYWAYRGGEF